MSFIQKIFRLTSQISGMRNDFSCMALALSEPDANYEIEMLYISFDTEKTTGKTVMLKAADYKEGELKGDFRISLEKSIYISITMLEDRLAVVTDEFFESVLRERVIVAAVKHYELKHKNIRKEDEKISYSGRVFDGDEISNLIDASLDFWLTTGKYAALFEKDFSEFLNVKHTLLTNSGSSANLLAFMALTSDTLGDRKINRGDEVITVAAAFPTTVSPIVQFGAVPVFVDVTLPQYNIDCSLLENALSEKTKAVMIAHTLGNPFDIDKVKRFCEKHKLWLIEDNCDSLGSRYCLDGKWAFTGTFGHLATSSFYPPHHITMGEGGAVYTSDTMIKRIVESLRDWGRDCWCPSGKDDTCKNRFSKHFGELPLGYDHKYVYSHFGYNLKVTDLQAAIGCAQLKKLSRFISSRKENWNALRRALEGLSDIFILPEPLENSDPSWFGFLLTVKDEAGICRYKIVEHLEKNGIQTRMLFAGNIIKHPLFDSMRKKGEGFRVASSLKNTEKILNDTFWVGVSPMMTENNLKRITENLYKVCREA